MSKLTTSLAAFLPLLLAGVAVAQDDLKKEVQSLEKRLGEMRAETDKALEEMEMKLAAARQGGSTESATSGFLLTGYMFSSFTDKEGEASSFGAGFNPLLLYKVNDRLLVEGELEFELEGDETEVGLEYAQALYTVSDYLVIGAGKFLNPSNYFQERLHPAWINKLPNAPLGFHGANRLQAGTHVGLQARGAASMGATRFEYAVYAGNGGVLREDNSEGEPGTIQFNNFEDPNNNKAVGGRLGFFPLPRLEVGYSYELAKVGVDEDAQIQAVDLNYVSQLDALKGTLDVRGQYVWSEVDRTTYTLVPPLSGTLDFNNSRSGGYIQVAYRPTALEKSPFLSSLEAVVRFDTLNVPQGSLTPVDIQRWAVGLNYWFDSGSVLKLAYQFEDKSDPTSSAIDEDTFFLQFGTGF